MVDELPRSTGSAAARFSDRSEIARRRLRRGVLLLFAAAVVLCAVVVWQRDARQIEDTRQLIDRRMGPVARYLAEHGTLPYDFPKNADQDLQGKTTGFTYLEPDVIRWAMTAGQPVVIGYGHVRGLIARPDGHAVMVYDHGKLRAEWLTQSQLQDRLAKQRQAAGLKP